uniref:Cyclin C-terminal domain-containing protein n=1 Tax=Peromyscus maniculatus bairdii TaxID=230844 RepID=A0A8C8TZQ9_PERMB
MYPPSMIATGSIGAAMQGLSAGSMSGDELTELLAGITGTEVDCLRACQQQIEATQTAPSPVPEAPQGSGSQGPSQTSTPTDVTAVHLWLGTGPLRWSPSRGGVTAPPPFLLEQSMPYLKPEGWPGPAYPHSVH